MYREVTGSDHSDGSGNLPVHSSVPGGYRCFSFAVIQPGNRSILMYYPRVDFMDSFLGEFHQLLRFLRAFSLFG